ncbi:hypothetical protein U6A24_06455 [Aquimarina gracilis]|uniref:Uncharacterized protein n=1 Tax=Aquimarina gracilis TaxID=874422 RepID=A0ABU5ZTW8_9FLAO|nr:hypothetical protein [Aquimarina gracilis]MEB3345093.1 hypothetical protein [Aquimarina gracilis]
MKYFFTIIFLCIIGFGKAQKVNVDHWIKDINFYQKTLEEKHIDLYHTLSKADFNKDILQLKSNLPNLTDFQVIAELMKLTRKIGNGKTDGHTAIPLWNTKRHLYPFDFFEFGRRDSCRTF